jgi:hypothetical protein
VMCNRAINIRLYFWHTESCDTEQKDRLDYKLKYEGRPKEGEHKGMTGAPPTGV